MPGFVGADARGGAGNKIVELCLVAVAHGEADDDREQRGALGHVILLVRADHHGRE
jgi:hypothetical protein